MRSKSQVALCTQALRRVTENCTKADSRPNQRMCFSPFLNLSTSSLFSQTCIFVIFLLFTNNYQASREIKDVLNLLKAIDSFYENFPLVTFLAYVRQFLRT